MTLGIALVIFGSATWAFLTATSEGDPFDSPYYGWSWIAVPLVALLAGLFRPVWPRPLYWAAALVLPSALALVVQGTLLHDPDEGASLWVAGEMFVAVQGWVALGAASLGRVLRGLFR